LREERKSESAAVDEPVLVVLLADLVNAADGWSAAGG
jgi:hypothetical protein